MAAYYLDSSALVKRYVREAGTPWIHDLTSLRASHVLYTVRVTGPEIIAALTKKVRTGEVGQHVVASASSIFRRDWRGRYDIIEVSAAIAERAMNFAERHGLRGYDAVHLAAAIEVHLQGRAGFAPLLTFVSADVHQLRVATAEGLSVDDPNAHR